MTVDTAPAWKALAELREDPGWCTTSDGEGYLNAHALERLDVIADILAELERMDGPGRDWFVRGLRAIAEEMDPPTSTQ